jgi:Gas vesicle synthesis protein GvpL/GvpF
VRIATPAVPTASTFSPGQADARSDAPASSARTGTEFLERRLERARHVPPEVEILRRELGSLVRSERVAAGEREGLVTVFHLVSDQELDTYRRHASRLLSKLQPRTVSVTGPWPVFAFAPDLF